MTNTVELSEDRRTLTIRSTDGHKTAHLRSSLPDGFTDEHAFAALEFEFTREPGQQHTMWRRHIGGHWYLYTGIHSGPPTWWWPHVKVGSTFLVGWLRRAYQVQIRKETPNA